MAVPKLKNKNAMLMRAFSEVRGSAFLSHFSEEFVASLAGVAELENFTQPCTLTVESEFNSEIYILLKGEVEVRVGGELIAVLNGAGEVFGEMSMIAEMPCSATVSTVAESSFIKITHEALRLLILEEGRHFSQELYRVFSKILTHRLVVTNDKARQFEKANNELRSLHRELDELNQKRLDEISSHNMKIFERINQYYYQEFRQLENGVKKMISKTPSKIEEEVVQVLKASHSKIRPLADMYNSERVLANKRVLLAEPNNKQQRIAKMALRGSGMELDIAASEEETKNHLAQNQYDIMMISEDLIGLAEYAHTGHPQMKLVLMTSSKVPEYIQYFKNHPFLTDVVSRNPEDRTLTVKNIFTTVGKLASEDIFGVEKYLAWGAEIHAVDILKSEQRPETLEQMATLFQEFGIRESIIERCRMVGEEMLMNALYDAPVDEKGQPLFNHLDRRNKVVLQPEQQGVFRYACDGMIAAIAIQDPFGSFDRETLMAYLSGCYSGEENKLHKGKGGGGMGIHLMVETSDLTVFNIQKNFRTEVIALFNLDSSQKSANQFPSFHLFYR